MLTDSYKDNVKFIDNAITRKESFDIIKKTLAIGKDEITLFYIDGFTKDATMQKLMMHFLSLPSLTDKGDGSARSFVIHSVPYVETDVTCDTDEMITFVLSGATLILGSTFGKNAVIVDARTYPARDTSEPESDRVVRGSKDGFVETLIYNTALVRRRLRTPNLRVKHMSVGESSKTDIAICYIDGTADKKLVCDVEKKIANISTSALTMGHQSLVECLVKTHWYNPFPKVRTTERPDAACAQLLEGSVIIITDNSPEVIVLPTTIFDFMQETGDFYFPPLTGSYIRLLRHFTFYLTIFLTPIWFLFARFPSLTPQCLSFLIPSSSAKLPLIIQLLLVEFIVDVLKLASMNTPNMLTNSLSVVGGLILGDFAVTAGLLIPEVILLAAFSAIANFTQRSLELGYAFKFLRILLLILIELFSVWGIAIGSVLIVVFIATNKTVTPSHSYLYPLIPFNAKALLSLFVRLPKSKKEK